MVRNTLSNHFNEFIFSLETLIKRKFEIIFFKYILHSLITAMKFYKIKYKTFNEQKNKTVHNRKL